MPAGQTPVTVTVVAHNDLVDAVQPGDRYVTNLSNALFKTYIFDILVFKSPVYFVQYPFV